MIAAQLSGVEGAFAVAVVAVATPLDVRMTLQADVIRE